MKKKLITLFFMTAVFCIFFDNNVIAKENFDFFQQAQSSFKVYKYKNDKEALSLAYANVQAAIDENPKDYKRYFLAGLILNEMNDNTVSFQLAEQYFEKSIELNPSDATLYYAIGQYYYSKNKPSVSIGYYEKALLLDKNLLGPKYITILTESYIKTAQLPRGIYFYKKYIDKNSTNPAYLILTTAYMLNLDERKDEAKEYLYSVINNSSYEEKDKITAQEMIEELKQ
ncbi:MAG: tetratricopeptide repeat protein [Candidatus Gastranaerophilales bacterium]|nr:tetratricopeptide repeat protein [Candidatus Gastranaerophilales bacterium]